MLLYIIGAVPQKGTTIPYIKKGAILIDSILNNISIPRGFGLRLGVVGT